MEDRYSKLIFKKGDRDNVEDYRWITIMDSGYKIYAEWLSGKLNKEIDEEAVLDKTWFEIRKGKEMIGSIYVLTEIIEEYIRKEKENFLFALQTLKRNSIS